MPIGGKGWSLCPLSPGVAKVNGNAWKLHFCNFEILHFEISKGESSSFSAPPQGGALCRQPLPEPPTPPHPATDCYI